VWWRRCRDRGARAAKDDKRCARNGRGGEDRPGDILVDSQGRTLYLFKADKGTTSACSGTCAVAWPPLRAHGRPTVGSRAKRSLIGSTARADGKPQVTYNGHPLYLYVDDQKPGDTNGQGVKAFGARWFALTPNGTQISSRPSAGSGGVSGY
jgi:predicted lipoprotein with Yx(FWY)xxD motif